MARVSEGGLEPPPPYRGLGPQPSASTKFRHSDRVADRVYETHILGSTLINSLAVRPLSRVRRKRLLAVAGVGLSLAVLMLRKAETRAIRGDWPPIFAHRGASARAPENTLEAFRLAVEAGAGGLELDVRVTRDGEVVVIHDASVDRTTEGSGAVAGMTLAELRSLDAGYRFSPDGGSTYPYRGRGLGIPTLAGVYEEFPTARVNLDIKGPGQEAEEAVLRVIRSAGAEERSLVVSDDHAVV